MKIIISFSSMRHGKHEMNTILFFRKYENIMFSGSSRFTVPYYWYYPLVDSGKVYLFPKSRWPIFCRNLFSDTSNYQQRSKFSSQNKPLWTHVVLIIDVINKTIKANDPLKRVLAIKDRGISHNNWIGYRAFDKSKWVKSLKSK